MISLSDVSAIRIKGKDDENVWGAALDGASDEYSKDAPKAYVEIEKPKINYALI